MYNKAKDRWLSEQNSFNNALFLMMIETLSELNLPGHNVQLNKKNGDRISYGSLVSRHNMNDFVRAYPMIAHAFHEVNERRNKLPGLHPYDMKSLARTKPLAETERDEFTSLLNIAYSEIIQLFDVHL
jgi:hypothetical protein